MQFPTSLWYACRSVLEVLNDARNQYIVQSCVEHAVRGSLQLGCVAEVLHFPILRHLPLLSSIYILLDVALLCSVICIRKDGLMRLDAAH